MLRSQITQTSVPFSCSRSSEIGGGFGIGASCLSNRGTAISLERVSIKEPQNVGPTIYQVTRDNA